MATRQRTRSSWKLNHGLERDRGIDRPPGQRVADQHGGPGYRGHQQELAQAEDEARVGAAARDRRARARSDAESDQEDREDDRERVDRGTEDQREQPRPDDLRAERSQPRERDRHIDRPGGRRARGLCRLRLGWRGAVGDGAGDGESDEADHAVDRRRRVGRDRHVVDAQQIESGEQAAEHGAGDVAGIENSEPGNAARRRFKKTRDRRQRRAHEHGRRHQQRAAYQAAQENPRRAGAAERGVQPTRIGQHPQDRYSEHADADFDQRIDLERMEARGDQIGQRQAAQAHAAHEGAEQHAERDGRRADHQLQKLEPDDLIDQRRAAASEEEHEDGGKQRGGYGGPGPVAGAGAHTRTRAPSALGRG